MPQMLLMHRNENSCYGAVSTLITTTLSIKVTVSEHNKPQYYVPLFLERKRFTIVACFFSEDPIWSTK